MNCVRFHTEKRGLALTASGDKTVHLWSYHTQHQPDGSGGEQDEATGATVGGGMLLLLLFDTSDLSVLRIYVVRHLFNKISSSGGEIR